MRFLVIDDEPDFLEMMRLMLRSLGQEDVTCCTSPDDQWHRLGEYDVLLTDYRLGKGVCGLDVARSFKAQRPGGVALVLSGFDLPRGVADLQIVKPLEFEGVEKMVRWLSDSPPSMM